MSILGKLHDLGKAIKLKKRRGVILPKSKKRSKNKIRKLERYGKELNDRKIKSEIWFKTKHFEKEFNLKYWHFNKPLGYYIPDIHSSKFKIIIEIDEPHHLEPKQRLRDEKREKYLYSKGYVIFRIPAFNDETAKKTILELKELVNKLDKKYLIKKQSACIS